MCFSTLSWRDSKHLSLTGAVTVTTTDLDDLHHLDTGAAARPDGLCFFCLKVYQSFQTQTLRLSTEPRRKFVANWFRFWLILFLSTRRSRSPKRRRYVCSEVPGVKSFWNCYGSCLFGHILSFVVSPSPRRDRHRSKSPRRHRSRSRDRRHRSKSPGNAPSRSGAAEGLLLLLYQQVAADSCCLYHFTGLCDYTQKEMFGKRLFFN